MTISFTNERIKERMIDYSISQIFIEKDLSDKDDNKIKIFSIQHYVVYLSSYKIFLDHPILGIGPKMFRLLCLEEKYLTMYGYNSCSTHPHNTYIQVLVEVGLIGFLPILILVIYVYIKIFYHIYLTIFKNKPILDDLQIGMYIALAISLWPFVPTGSFFNSWLSIIYYLPFPFIFYFNNKNFLYEK